MARQIITSLALAISAGSVRGLKPALEDGSASATQGFTSGLSMATAVTLLIWLVALYQAVQGYIKPPQRPDSRFWYWGVRLQWFFLIGLPCGLATYGISSELSCAGYHWLGFWNFRQVQCDEGPLANVFDFTARPAAIESALPGSLASGIPKIFHQTGKSELVSERHRAWMSSWDKQNPGWVHVFWSDADVRKLIADKYPNVLPQFDGYPLGIMRADMMRPYVLYTYGGVYMDLDYEALTPLESHLGGDSAVLLASPFKGIDGGLQNSLMGSSPRHPLWETVFEVMSRRFNEWRSSGAVCVSQENCSPLSMTGPQALSEALSTFERQAHRQHTVGRLPPEPFMFGHAEKGVPGVARHHFDDTWILDQGRHRFQVISSGLCALCTVWLACWMAVCRWQEMYNPKGIPPVDSQTACSP